MINDTKIDTEIPVLFPVQLRNGRCWAFCTLSTHSHSFVHHIGIFLHYEMQNKMLPVCGWVCAVGTWYHCPQANERIGLNRTGITVMQKYMCLVAFGSFLWSFGWDVVLLWPVSTLTLTICINESNAITSLIVWYGLIKTMVQCAHKQSHAHDHSRSHIWDGWTMYNVFKPKNRTWLD